MAEGSLIALGRFVRAHGIRGEVRLAPYNADSPTLPRLKAARLALPDGSFRDIEVTRVAPQKHQFIFALAGVTTRNEAEALVGAELLVSREDLAPLGEGEYYLADQIGLPVVTEDGTELGVFADLMETGANDVLVVRREGSREEILLPDIPGVVLDRDPAKGRILVRVPPGLLDDD